MTPEEKIGANLAGLSSLLNQPQNKNPNGEPDFIAKDLLKIEQMVVDNNQEMETTTQHISEKLNNIMATVQIIKDKIKYFKDEAAKCKEQIQNNTGYVDTLNKELEANTEENRRLNEELKLVKRESADLKTTQLQKIQEIKQLNASHQTQFQKQVEQLNIELSDITSNLQRVSNENRELHDKIDKETIKKKAIREHIYAIIDENKKLKEMLENMNQSILEAYDVLNTLSNLKTIKHLDFQAVLKEVRRILNIQDTEGANLPPPPPPPPPLPPSIPLPPPPPTPRQSSQLIQPPLRVGVLAPGLKKTLERKPGLNGGTRKKHTTFKNTTFKKGCAKKTKNNRDAFVHFKCEKV